LSGTQDDERKEECGTRGMREAAREREREREASVERRRNETVYTRHLCIKGVAALAFLHDARLCDCF